MKALPFIAALLFPSAAYAHTYTVTATVYHPAYAGHTTACGNTYDHWGVSAAHPYLPCGSRVRVTHQGRSLLVPIRDRCDCSLDLSAGAAHRLGVPIDGIARVRISR